MYQLGGIIWSRLANRVSGIRDRFRGYSPSPFRLRNIDPPTKTDEEMTPSKLRASCFGHGGLKHTSKFRRHLLSPYGSAMINHRAFSASDLSQRIEMPSLGGFPASFSDKYHIYSCHSLKVGPLVPPDIHPRSWTSYCLGTFANCANHLYIMIKHRNARTPPAQRLHLPLPHGDNPAVAVSFNPHISMPTPFLR